MPIKEFRAIIAVKPEQREREGIFNVLDLFKDFCFPFPPDGSLFCPARGDIHGIEGINEIPQETLSAVGDSIGLQESGFAFIPLVGFDGDLFSKEGAGFGGGSSSASVFYPGRL